jgi:hypothetical protein
VEPGCFSAQPNSDPHLSTSLHVKILLNAIICPVEMKKPQTQLLFKINKKIGLKKLKSRTFAPSSGKAG